MRKLLSTLFVSFLFISYSFTQSICTADSSVHIVVMGSSTAQGAGASPIDSAWVNLYRDYLQSINPENEVTNLARGGYTTYQLMPTDNVPPTGRPLPDSTRNISRAVALMPDGIVINLPSNDVSSGFTVEEQLANFETMVSVANDANIPIWVCTTQPKNYGGNAIPIQKQMDVRDSIIARYSPMVLDFWNGLAAPDNQIDPAYDSGDGTHLNNAGHHLLFTRARDAEIALQLIESPDYIDYAVYSLDAITAPDCGIASSTYDITIYNRGLDDTADIPVVLSVEQVSTGQLVVYRDTILGGLLNCEERVVSFVIDTEVAGDYIFTTSIEPPIDGAVNNNQMIQTEHFEGVPTLTGIGGTVCVNEDLLLQATAAAGDSIHWYDAAVGGNLVGTGPFYQTPSLSNTTSYFAEAFRGNFVENRSLFTNDIFDRDWNGFMFDLIADADIILDSLEFKVDTFGLQLVDIYTREGSHIGYELDPSAWSHAGSFPMDVKGPTEWSALDLGGIAMEVGDSLALYIELQNPANTMFYLAVPDPITRSTDELTLYSGTGISHNFSETYFPRDWNGSVYYHYDQPFGDCSSGRIAVEAAVSMPVIDLGVDQTITTSESVLLDIGSGYSDIEWTGGSSQSTLLIDGQAYGTGVFPIGVSALDEFGCMASDTILITINPSVGTTDLTAAAVTIWPNPVSDYLQLEYPLGKWDVRFRDQWGQMVWQQYSAGKQDKVNTQDWVPGVYFLEMSNERGETLVQKIVVSR